MDKQVVKIIIEKIDCEHHFVITMSQLPSRLLMLMSGVVGTLTSFQIHNQSSCEIKYESDLDLSVYFLLLETNNTAILYGLPKARLVPKPQLY